MNFCSRLSRLSANSHVMVRVIRKIEKAYYFLWRMCRLVLLHLIGARESGPPIFSLFQLCRSSSSALLGGCAIADIYEDACKVVSDFGESIRSLDLYHVRNKRTSTKGDTRLFHPTRAFNYTGRWCMLSAFSYISKKTENKGIPYLLFPPHLKNSLCSFEINISWSGHSNRFQSF